MLPEWWYRPLPAEISGNVTIASVDIPLFNLGQGSGSLFNLTPRIDFGPAPDGASYNATTHTVTWNIGDLEYGEVRMIAIMVKAPQATGVITNTATIAGPFDPDPTNNSSTWDTTVVNPTDFDLEVFKTDSADPVVTGDSFTYTVTIRNNGPADVTGEFYVYDELPDEVEYQSDNVTRGSSEYIETSSGNYVMWTLDGLASGASENLTIEVIAPEETGIIWERRFRHGRMDS
jgi:uncharacterized repeat protein (TIGR01451 family)